MMWSMQSLLVRAAILRFHTNVLSQARCRPAYHPFMTITQPSLNSYSTVGACSLVQPAESQLRPTVSLLSQFDQKRMYASKSKDKKNKKDKKEKGGKKGAKPKVELTEDELNSAIDYDKMTEQMELAIGNLKREYIEQLSLRTSSGMLDMLQVETPDGKFPLIQLGQIVQKNPRLVVVNLTTCPQYIPAVKDAIDRSGMNLNPQQDGTTLFIPIPKVTREHRETLAKNAKALCEKTKEKLRDIHNHFSRDLKKKKSSISEDLVHNVQETIDATQRQYQSSAEELLTMKHKELLGDK